jgi:hypothetical protein
MIPQFSQLFIYSPDKSNSICKIFISTPTLDKEQTLGRLFGIIEIESPDRALWDTIEDLAEKLETDYYGEDNIQLALGKPNRAVSIEETFEKSIQTFNDKLIELIKGGKLANLLDKISILIGTFKEGNIYFATIGNISAFVIHQTKSQEYRLINVLDTTGGRETKINPFKILSNVINGQINGNDSLLFCTNSLLDYLSLDKIKQTLTTQEPATAARHLKDLLLEASINTTFAAVIIKLAATTVAEKGEKEIKLPQKSLDHLVITERTTEQYLSPPIKVSLVKYSSLLLNKTKNIASNLSQKSSAYLKQRKEKNQKRIAKIVETSSPSLEPTIMTPPTTPPSPALTSTVTISLGKKTTAIISKIKNIAKKLGAQFLRLIKSFSQWLGRLIKSLYIIIINKNNQRREISQKLYNDFINWLANLIKKFKALPRLSQMLLIICLILFILFTESIVLISKNRFSGETQANFDNLVTQIQQKNDEAESALIYNDENRAQKLLIEARELTSQLQPQNKTQRQNVKNLEEKLNTLGLKLQHIINSTPNLIADLSNQTGNPTEFNAATLNLINDKIYTVNDLRNTFYSIDLSNNSIKPLNLQSNNPQIKLSTIFKNDLLYYHGGNGLTKFNTADNSLENVEIDLSGQENKINNLGTYNNYLYILNNSNNQIYRYSKTTTGFSQPINWIKDGSDIKNTIALTIDGDVYLATNDGQIQKFTSGKKQLFSISDLEVKLGSTTKIWTTTKSTYLYVLDPQNQRLLVFNKSNGKIKVQYFMENFNQLKDMAIAEKEKKAYLLNSNSIYQIDLVN